MNIPTSLTTLLVVAAVVAALGTIYSLVTDLYLRDRSRVRQRISTEFHNRARNQQSPLFKNLDATTIVPARTGLRHRLEVMIEQSGLSCTPGQLGFISAVIGLILAAIGALLGPYWWVGLILSLLGAYAPLLYVKHKRNQRLAKLLTQLPDALDLIGRVLRAGQSLSQGLQSVSTEFAPPLAVEFNACYEQQNMGLPTEIAFQDLARRTGLLEIKIFVLALLVQRQTGGNLAELTEKIAAIIRERQRIRGHIRTLTAEGRLQATILLALPIAMFLITAIINRPYAFELFRHPQLIGATLGCEALGAVCIRKIVNFDF